MKLYISFTLLLVYLWCYKITAIKIRPPVHVVTPRPLQIDEARSAPFYYHNWMRRMDLQKNTTKSTTTKPITKTPDLIFAEFESDNAMGKSIRKLLEKEKIKQISSTTTDYVPDQLDVKNQEANYGLSKPIIVKDDTENDHSETVNHSDVYSNVYSEAPAPIYIPPQSFTTSGTTTTAAPISTNLESVWSIIDNEKNNEYPDQWQEVPVGSNVDNDNDKPQDDKQENNENIVIDENFALPGLKTNPGNDGENESRAIRVEPNIRFPYINLKPFQLKNLKEAFTNSKKGSGNMYTSLDNYQEVKHPVRGEAQDIVPTRQPIDRYNPAQPHLPPASYGSKQSHPSSSPVKAIANLVPPPPPPRPKLTDNDFPSPISYDSFPPYPPSGPIAAPPPSVPSPAAPNPPIIMYQPPTDNSAPIQDSDDNGDDGSPMDMGYQYSPPSRPQTFLPTLPPVSKPFKGYSYDKPSMSDSAPPAMDMGSPNFHGYNYDKPNIAPPTMDTNKPDFHGYHYHKPEATPYHEDHQSGPNHDDHHAAPYHEDHPSAPSHDGHHHYGPHGPPSSQYEPDYPELIFDKPHGGTDDTKGADAMKGNDMMGMMPPPPPMAQDMKPDNSGPPMDDSGFPHDFPHDFPDDYKYNFDDHDHDFYHHHHHHTTTTTTTTEMPRVSRYSYYYLGKKLYYLPLYFSVYFIVYVAALIIKAVLRHKIVYPNSFRPNDQTASFFSKRSVDSWDFSNEKLHEITGVVTKAIGVAAEKYMNKET